MLSSLSALAERPNLVMRLFHKDVVTTQGVYGIWICENGEWRNVIIDDYFPCKNEYTGPAFSRANGNELWVLLIEKAYAKVYGSYEIIEGGNPPVALRDLTGAPYENKDEGDENELWEFITEMDKKGFYILKNCLIFFFFSL